MADPRILIVTPEISYLPEDLGDRARHMHAKAGGLADVRWIEVGPAGHNDLLGFPVVWQEIEAFVSTLSSPGAL